MNPFNLAGPEFLGFWLVGAIVAAFVVAAVREWVTRAPFERDADEVAARLHPTELAFLVGGLGRALEATIAGLHHRGAIALDSDGMFVIGRPDEPGSEVERQVLDRVAMGRDPFRVEVLEPALTARLEQDGLLIADRTRARVMMMLPGLLWVAVGAIKVAVGVSRHRPLGILATLLVAAIVVLVRFTRVPRLTSLGSRVVARVTAANRGLETTASAAPAQLSGPDMTLAYAIYGSEVASLALLPLLPSHQAALTGAVLGDSGGGGCGSGGCGSGCGGGCGGCGGCS